VYAGDQNNKKLVIISKDAESPKYIDISEKSSSKEMVLTPYRVMLIKNDSQLIVGCLEG
jgi:hypothetical protein